jgi:peptidoglycan/LPS O-acetylase OafA/YrhL
MTQPRLQNLQALRGIAVLLVLWRHVLLFGEKYARGEMVLPDALKIGDAGVDLFFVISGFVMTLVSRGRFQLRGEIASFLYKRFVRVYPLYWIYSLAILAIYLRWPHLVNSSQDHHVDLLASFLLLPQDILPLLGQGWTLEHEIYFYLVFALMLLAPERLLPGLLLLWGALVAFGWNFLSGSEPGQLQAIRHACNPLTLEFILGALVGLAIGRGWRRAGFLWLILGYVLLLIGSAVVDPLRFTGLRLFCFGIPAALMVFGAVALELQDRFRLPHWLGVIGDASYSLYLSHILVLSAAGRLWQALPNLHPGGWDAAGLALLMILAAMGFGLASHFLLEKPVLRFLRTRSPRGLIPAPHSPDLPR